jgi:hypothetical protein
MINLIRFYALAYFIAIVDIYRKQFADCVLIHGICITDVQGQKIKDSMPFI